MVVGEANVLLVENWNPRSVAEVAPPVPKEVMLPFNMPPVVESPDAAEAVSVGAVHDAAMPSNKISSIRTPCRPPVLLFLKRNLNWVAVDAGMLNVPELIMVDEVGVAEVNVVVDQVAPLSVENSTKQGLSGLPEPYVPILKERVSPPV